MFDAKDLELWANGIWFGELASMINGFCYDTRLLKPGDIFLAFKTDRRDGHGFLQTALNKGAVGAIVEKIDEGVNIPQLKVSNVLKALHCIANNYRRKLDMPVIGVTGSCGKTSTKEMLRTVLGEDRVYATYSNNNNLLGVPLALLELNEALHQVAAIEAGANLLGEMEQLGKIIEPNLGIITCVGVAHSGYFGDIESIAREKCKLLENLQLDGVGIFPSSCYEYVCFKNIDRKKKILIPVGDAMPVPGLGEEEYFYYGFNYDKGFVSLSIGQDRQILKTFKLPLMSEGMLQNAGLVIIASWHLGIDDYMIQEQFLSWSPVEKRGEVIIDGGKFYYMDCYNSNPQSLIDALEFFQRKYLDQESRMFVLGGMGELGEKSPEMHYNAGRKIKLKKGDKVLLVEKGFPEMNKLKDGLLKAGACEDQLQMCRDLQEVSGYLKNFNGAVFLKGSKSVHLWTLVENN